MIKSRRALAAVLSALLLPGMLPAQGRAPTSFSISGKIIVPVSDFDGMFEVVLVQNLEQFVQATVADFQGRYSFRGLARGTYFITMKLDGFEDVRQRVDVGTVADTILNIILDFKEERIVAPRLDFSGENEEVVDVAELSRTYPPKMVAELESAREDMFKGNYARAQSRLESVLREVPDFYHAHRMMGMLHQKQARYRDAETAFRTAADLKPASAAPLVNLGSLYLEEAQASAAKGSAVVRTILNEALGSLNAAVKLNPDAAFAYYLLGVTYHRSAFYEDAEDNLKTALLLEPRLTQARLALANVYVRIQEWANAIEQLDKYLADNPATESRKEIESMRGRILQRSQARLR